MKIAARQKRREQPQAGNALVEYIILVVAMGVLLLTIVVEYGASVDGHWRLADEDSAWEDIESGLSDGGGDGEDGDGCSGYYYNSATGRWHDAATNLFVSFSDAEDAGC